MDFYSDFYKFIVKFYFKILLKIKNLYLKNNQTLFTKLNTIGRLILFIPV